VVGVEFPHSPQHPHRVLSPREVDDESHFAARATDQVVGGAVEFSARLGPSFRVRVRGFGGKKQKLPRGVGIALTR
jgi:hypothetical protein